MHSLSPPRLNFNPYSLPLPNLNPSFSHIPQALSDLSSRQLSQSPNRNRSIKVWDLPKITEQRGGKKLRNSMPSQQASVINTSLAEYIRLIKSETKRPTIPRKPSTRTRPKLRLPISKHHHQTPPTLCITTREGPTLRPKYTSKLLIKKPALWQPLRLQSYEGGGEGDSDPGFHVLRYESSLVQNRSMEAGNQKSEGLLGKSATPDPKIMLIAAEGEAKLKEVIVTSREGGKVGKKEGRRRQTAGRIQGWEVSPRNISPVCNI